MKYIEDGIILPRSQLRKSFYRRYCLLGNKTTVSPMLCSPGILVFKSTQPRMMYS